MKPSALILNQLEELGRDGDERIPSSLIDKTYSWYCLMCGNEAWRRVAATRTSEQIANLIRGLVLYSRASGQQFGSVSPVIVLWAALGERAPSWEAGLTSWIVKHRINPYEPFGTEKNTGATTYAELRAWWEARSRAWELAERHRREEARKARAVRATPRLANAIRRGDLLAVKALLGKGADVNKTLPDGGSLIMFAESHGRALVAQYLKSLGIS